MKTIFSIIIMVLAISANAQWVLQNTGTPADLGGISFLNQYTGYICGSSTVIKTTNGGLNWINVSPPNLNKPLMKIQAVDSNNIYCVGSFNTIIKSTNGGTNWQIIRNGPFGTGVSFFALFFLNSKTGWIGGQFYNPYIFITTDGCETFDSIPSPKLDGRVHDFYFIDANTGLACGDNGILRKSTDGGHNWSHVNIPVGGYYFEFRNLSFINNTTGYTASHSRKIFKTTDFGNNWDSLPSISYSLDFVVHHICFPSEGKGWAVGTGYDVYHTSNGGLNWVTQGGWHANGVLFINDSIGWKAGNAGSVYKTTNGGIPTFISGNTFEVQDFELFQNYPNPFNSQTVIEFRIAKKEIYKLELFNINGKKEKTLFYGLKNPGFYKYNFNISDLGTGVYFLRLLSSDISVTRKIIMVK